jgi:NAD-dependent dihydropyrimidine dehydrogenase PreA subunit
MSNSAPSQIVLCRCAHTKLTDAQTFGQVERALRGAGWDIEVVEDLCGLAAAHDPRLRDWALQEGLAIVACYERAVRAMFQAGGATLREDAAIVNLRASSAGSALARLGLSAEAVPHGSAQPREAVPSVPVPPSPAAPVGAGQWMPWFPVIDVDRCVGCRQCLSFCLFGVYALVDGKVRVAKPQSCKTNCPACARVCPELAIIFPKYSDSPINGDEVRPEHLARKDVKINVKELAKGDLRQMIANRNAPLGGVSLGDLEAKAKELGKRHHPANPELPPSDGPQR